MKGLVVALLVFIAAGVGYLSYDQLQKYEAADEMATRIFQSRIAEGIRATLAPRDAVEQYFEEHEQFPATLAAAGYSSFSSRLPDHIREVVAGPDGQVIVGFRTRALGLPAEIKEASLTMVPEVTSGGRLSWSCVASAPFSSHDDILPAACLP